MQNIGAALKEPAQALAQEAAAVGIHESRKLAQHADELVHLVDEIQLANLLKAIPGKPPPVCSPFRA